MKATIRYQSLLRFPEVKALVGLSRTQIWRMEQQGLFPRRVQISNRIVGWKSDDIEKFINSRAVVNGGRV